MQSTSLFQRLSEMSATDSSIRSLLSLVERIHEESVAISRTAIRRFPEYTLHDDVHIRKVIQIMGCLIPDQTLGRLGALEIGALLLAATLHDIGMAPTQDEIDCLLNVSDKPEFRGDVAKYTSYRNDSPDIIGQIESFRTNQCHQEAHRLEVSLLTDYLRITHAQRGMKFIRSRYKDRLFYGHYGFAEDLAKVCFSHCEDPYALSDLSCWTLVRSPDEYANWRFVAVLLRLSDILDFDSSRTPRVLFGHLSFQSSQSISEWQKHLSVSAVGIGPGNMTVSARCPDPYTHHDVLGHVTEVEKELKAATDLISQMHHSQKSDISDHYHLDLPFKVNVENVQPEMDQDGRPIYEYQNISFQLDDERIMELVMGVNLYADRHLFLRELMQNAVDTCRYRADFHLKGGALGDYSPQVTIRLIRSSEAEGVEVDDNGMGMDREILGNYFAKVGSSYYRSRSFLGNVRRHALDFKPISQFGIGVLSVFMVSDCLDVETKAIDDKESSLSIGIGGPARLFWVKEGNRTEAGTTVRLKLKIPSSEFLMKAERKGKKRHDEDYVPSLRETVSVVAPHLEFPVTIQEDGQTTNFRGKWTLPEADVPYPGFIERVYLDLSKDGPQGLDGIACVFLLRKDRSAASPSYEEMIVFDDDGEADYLCHSPGTIEIHQTAYNRHGDEIDSGWTYAASSEGRWSQEGFHVPYPLFRDRSHWNSSGHQRAPSINFPFPVHYDLNCHGPFRLPLSADRKSVLPTKEAIDACRRITRVVADLFLSTIGESAILSNKQFLVRMLQFRFEAADVFKELLDRYMDTDAELRQLAEDREKRWRELGIKR